MICFFIGAIYARRAGMFRKQGDYYYGSKEYKRLDEAGEKWMMAGFHILVAPFVILLFVGLFSLLFDGLT